MTTTTTVTTSPATSTATADPVTTKVVGLLGGASSVLAPLMFLAGAATSPPQESPAAKDYIASLAADPTLSGISANFFHYSWVLFAIAAFASLGLVRGRRGRAVTLVGGLLSVFGSIQMSGLIYNDWVLSATGNLLTEADAVAVFEAVNGAPSVAFWLLSAKVCALLGFPLLYAGLARAGVLSWWLVPLSLLPMIAFGVIGGVLGIALAVVLYAPSYAVGLRLVQRARLAR